MNCKNCGYGLKQRCGDFEKIICTYEEGECVKITELEKQIEKMKSDVMGNVKWADQNKNEQMYCKLNAMINQWERKENGES